MRLEDAIYKILAANAGVSALVGTRIYEGVPVQSASYPLISFRRDQREADGLLTGKFTAGPPKYRIAIYCAAKGTDGSKKSKNVADAVRVCLQGYSGVETDTLASPVTTITIHRIWPGLHTELPYVDQTQTYEFLSEFDVWASEAQPD